MKLLLLAVLIALPIAACSAGGENPEAATAAESQPDIAGSPVASTTATTTSTILPPPSTTTTISPIFTYTCETLKRKDEVKKVIAIAKVEAELHLHLPPLVREYSGIQATITGRTEKVEPTQTKPFEEVALEAKPFKQGTIICATEYEGIKEGAIKLVGNSCWRKGIALACAYGEYVPEPLWTSSSRLDDRDRTKEGIPLPVLANRCVKQLETDLRLDLTA